MGCVQNVWQQLRDFYAFLFTNVNFNENELVCKYKIQLINHLNIVFVFFASFFRFVLWVFYGFVERPLLCFTDASCPKYIVLFHSLNSCLEFFRVLSNYNEDVVHLRNHN